MLIMTIDLGETTIEGTSTVFGLRTRLFAGLFKW